MKKNISSRLALLAMVVSIIVLPVNSSVKHLSSNRAAAVSVAVLSGSPLPAPPLPPGFSVSRASGSPLPAPPLPPGFSVSRASGSPLPAPPLPPGFSVSRASGSPLPAPPLPPGRLA
jgi:hypothetical protein